MMSRLLAVLVAATLLCSAAVAQQAQQRPGQYPPPARATPAPPAQPQRAPPPPQAQQQQESGDEESGADIATLVHITVQAKTPASAREDIEKQLTMIGKLFNLQFDHYGQIKMTNNAEGVTFEIEAVMIAGAEASPSAGSSAGTRPQQR